MWQGPGFASIQSPSSKCSQRVDGLHFYIILYRFIIHHDNDLWNDCLHLNRYGKKQKEGKEGGRSLGIRYILEYPNLPVPLDTVYAEEGRPGDSEAPFQLNNSRLLYLTSEFLCFKAHKIT